MPAEIILPHGTEFVPTDHIPRLIARALNPDPGQQPLRVSYFTKTARPSAAGETATRRYLPIDDNDKKALADIWNEKGLPPLPEHATVDQVKPYREAIDAAGLDWELGICWDSPQLSGGILYHDAVAEHTKALKAAIRQGDLKPVVPHTRQPADELHPASEVSVSDLTQYVDRFNVAVRISPKQSVFTESEAGSVVTGHLPQEEYDAMIAEKKARQAKGQYTMREVAQALADAYSLDGAALLKKMKADYYAGTLTVRSRDTEAPVLPGHTLRVFYDLMFPDDIRAMLKRWGWTREFPFISEAAVPAKNATSTGTEKKWVPEKLAELRAYRDTHTEAETAAHFKISGPRVRELLAKMKPKAKGYSAFTQGV